MTDDERKRLHGGGGQSAPTQRPAPSFQPAESTPQQTLPESAGLPDPRFTIPEGSTIIIGPSGCGKTVWLSILQVFAHKAMTQKMLLPAKVRRCFFKPLNDDMNTLAERGASILLEGAPNNISATENITKYRFHMKVEQSFNPVLNWFINRYGRVQEHLFTAVDGPGGSIFGSLDKQIVESSITHDTLSRYRDTMVRATRKASGLIICLDVSDPIRAQSVIMSLPSFLFEVEKSGKFSVERICINLAKAEKLLPMEAGAIDLLKGDCPAEKAKELIGPSIGALMTYAERIPIYVGWSSSFGFDQEGTPNFLRISDQDDRLRTWEENRMPEIINNHWNPFRVLEPLIYMATGEPCNLVRI